MGVQRIWHAGYEKLTALCKSDSTATTNLFSASHST